MRWILCAGVLIASTASFAQQVAPPASYTFTVAPEDANVMFNQLGKLDWATVNPLMQKLIAQLQAQNKPVTPAPTQTPATPPQE